jgi:hypothetical protein
MYMMYNCACAGGDMQDTPHTSNRRASMESSYSLATVATSATGGTNMSSAAQSRAEALASAKGKVRTLFTLHIYTNKYKYK